MEMIDLIERVGSMGILVLIAWFGLRWGGRRVDRMLDHNQILIEQNREMIASFGLAIASFQNFETEERSTHNAVMIKLRKIEEAIVASQGG
jgi:hypothetical protein